MRILNVERSRIERAIITEELRTEGHIVVPVIPSWTEPETTIDRIVDLAPKYDLTIFSPEAFVPEHGPRVIATGLELAKSAQLYFAKAIPRISERGYHGPILAPTAMELDYVRRFSGDRRIDFLQKPFRVKELIARIGEYHLEHQKVA